MKKTSTDFIIISIKPRFVDKIFSGEKRYEYRKIFPEGVKVMFIYATAPVKKLVGIAFIDEVLRGDRGDIWQKTQQYGGIEETEYLKYFTGRNKACAVKINRVWKISEPVKLVFRPPQSYMFTDAKHNIYITNNEIVEMWSEPNIEDPLKILFKEYIEIKI